MSRSVDEARLRLSIFFFFGLSNTTPVQTGTKKISSSVKLLSSQMKLVTEPVKTFLSAQTTFDEQKTKRQLLPRWSWKSSPRDGGAGLYPLQPGDSTSGRANAALGRAAPC